MAMAAGLLGRCERRARGGLTLLMYHRVLPDEICGEYPLSNLAVPLSVFQRQMDWLATHCQVLPVADAVEQVHTGRGTRPFVSVTFDDGYADNAELAAPEMEKRGLRGTFFLTTSFVRTGKLLWHDQAAAQWNQWERGELCRVIHNKLPGVGDGSLSWRGAEEFVAFIRHLKPIDRTAILDELDQRRQPANVGQLYAAMSVDAAVDLFNKGHEIASHTRSHTPLRQLADQKVLEELQGSKAELESWIGGEVAGICYPNGDCDDGIAALAGRAGYKYGCTTRRGLNGVECDRFQMRRRAVFPSSVTGPSRRHSDLAYRAEVMGFHDWMRRVA